MSISDDVRKTISNTAGQTLETFREISATARKELSAPAGSPGNALAYPNAQGTNDVISGMERAIGKSRSSYRHLIQEPAVARVVVERPEGKQVVYYFCRTAAVALPSKTLLASYRAPVGHLASTEIGDVGRLPDGTEVTVLERAVLRPVFDDTGWDSTNSIVEGDGWGPFTINSFREFIVVPDREEAPEDIVSQIEAEESLAANISEGIRHGVIERMELRDQPILDQYQSTIFRLPLYSRLLMLGAPGTGKTTTLIRRLGQKLDVDSLNSEEREVIAGADTVRRNDHASSWIMFSPTELLRLYVKEAFAKEGIPASDEKIRTWTEQRTELARSVFGVLRAGSNRGVFILRETDSFVDNVAIENPIEWYADFDEWQRTAFLGNCRAAAQDLAGDSDGDVSDLGQRLYLHMADRGANTFGGLMHALSSESDAVQKLRASRRQSTDDLLNNALNLHNNRNKNFLDELATFLGTIQDGDDIEEEGQEDVGDEEDEEEIEPVRTPRYKAVMDWKRAVRAQSRAQVNNRALARTSRNAKIIEWLGDRTVEPATRDRIGKNLNVLARTRQFVSPAKAYIDRIPRRYQAFRRQRQEGGRWYKKGEISRRDISPLELDIVLLAILRGSNELLAVPSIRRDRDEPRWASLLRTRELYRNQVLVDEVTDFSPIQIACMAALANPDIRSFFACGDFNQRLTVWGSRTMDELRWVYPDIESQVVKVSYRQSRALNKFARALVETTGNSEYAATLPDHATNEGFPPVLSESLGDRNHLASWLGDRIVEIEMYVKRLPSIAVLVPLEEDVEPVAKALQNVLSEQNIPVLACVSGRIMGSDSGVRVFDVQHIKGLEFEAVFFVGVDQLSEMQPGLIDKYLYVGATRAATYLGIACYGKIPAAIEDLRSMFGESWPKV